MKSAFAAVVLMSAVTCASASQAMTLGIEQGGLRSDENSRDILGGFGGPAFSVRGVGIAQQLYAGGAPSIVTLASGFVTTGAEFGSQIDVFGVGTCLVPGASFFTCTAGLQLRNVPFDLPPPRTDVTITVPFTAAGHLNIPGAEFDLLGSGVLTAHQRCLFDCASEFSHFGTDAVWVFAPEPSVPEPSALLLAAVGLSFTIAINRRRRPNG